MRKRKLTRDPEVEYMEEFSMMPPDYDHVDEAVSSLGSRSSVRTEGGFIVNDIFGRVFKEHDRILGLEETSRGFYSDFVRKEKKLNEAHGLGGREGEVRPGSRRASPGTSDKKKKRC